MLKLHYRKNEYDHLYSMPTNQQMCLELNAAVTKYSKMID